MPEGVLPRPVSMLDSHVLMSPEFVIQADIKDGIIV